MQRSRLRPGRLPSTSHCQRPHPCAQPRRRGFTPNGASLGKGAWSARSAPRSSRPRGRKHRPGAARRPRSRASRPPRCFSAWRPPESTGATVRHRPPGPAPVPGSAAAASSTRRTSPPQRRRGFVREPDTPAATLRRPHPRGGSPPATLRHLFPRAGGRPGGDAAPVSTRRMPPRRRCRGGVREVESFEAPVPHPRRPSFLA